MDENEGDFNKYLTFFGLLAVAAALVTVSLLIANRVQPTQSTTFIDTSVADTILGPKICNIGETEFRGGCGIEVCGSDQRAYYTCGTEGTKWEFTACTYQFSCTNSATDISVADQIIAGSAPPASSQPPASELPDTAILFQGEERIIIAIFLLIIGALSIRLRVHSLKTQFSE